MGVWIVLGMMEISTIDCVDGFVTVNMVRIIELHILSR